MGIFILIVEAVSVTRRHMCLPPSTAIVCFDSPIEFQAVFGDRQECCGEGNDALRDADKEDGSVDEVRNGSDGNSEAENADDIPNDFMQPPHGYYENCG